MTFLDIYNTRPDKKGVGSSGFSQLMHLYNYCLKIKPEVIIESGTWKGQSSYLFFKACPNANIYCFDLDFSNLFWKNDKINYKEHDITEKEIPNISNKRHLIFFDDHINQEQRLNWAIKTGFKNIIFDDNIQENKLHEFKNPPIPTLEMLRAQNKLPNLKTYSILPFLGGKRNTNLTYIEP